MLSHIPALFHGKPRSVLVVGCGAGITAGTFLVYPEIERVVICEIEPLIPKVVANYFAKENYGVVKDRRVSLVFDDARHYVLTSREKFDIITSDPIHPWVKGAATLYTQEYFDLCRNLLNPGGLVTQWVPLYESNREAVKSEIATFFHAFPNGTIWSNDQDGEGYDVVLCGRMDAAAIDMDRLQARMKDEPLALSLKELGFKTMTGLLATYAGQRADLAPWLQDAQINRDGNLRLQYLAGLGLNFNQGRDIYNEMLAYRRFPGELFSGSDMQLRMLRLLIERHKPTK
jgi:spermidine synthase